MPFSFLHHTNKFLRGGLLDEIYFSHVLLQYQPNTDPAIVITSQCPNYCNTLSIAKFDLIIIPTLPDPVVEKVYRAIHQINRYQVDNAMDFLNIYLVDSPTHLFNNWGQVYNLREAFVQEVALIHVIHENNFFSLLL